MTPKGVDDIGFAASLEACIKMLAEIKPAYDDRCLAPAEQARRQAMDLTATLGWMRAAHGYAPALWCALAGLEEGVLPLVNAFLQARNEVGSVRSGSP